MICEICGKEYLYSCRRCTRRVETWGVDGLLYLTELAQRTDDIKSEELIPVINAYYKGKSKSNSAKANVLRTALRLLGYRGSFIGRIHQNSNSYISLRRRQNESGRRWGLRNAACDLCGEKERLSLHHIMPLSWGGVTSPENCITLCEKCHRETHKKLSKLLSREKLLEYLAPHFAEIKELAKKTVLNG